MIYGYEVAEKLKRGVGFGIEVGRGEERVGGFGDFADGVENIFRERGVVLEEGCDFCDFDGGAAGLAGVDEEQGELGEAVEGNDSRWFIQTLFLVEDGFASGRDGVVDP